MFEVLLSSEARSFFEDAGASLQRRLDRAFDALRLNPQRHNNIKPLKGKFSGLFRYRVGDWRIIFVVDHANHRVWIHDIAHRSEVYE